MKSKAIKVRKGAWAHEEDNLLRKCIANYGEGKWHLVPERAGLNRCRKSCRLRWLNYLRPSIKRGEFAEDEVDLIIRLHNLLGNRWSLIAGRLPGRTANDIKNYWNTHLQKKICETSCCRKQVVERGENSSSRVIKPLPRSLFNSAPYIHPPSSANNICNYNGTLINDIKPPSPPAPDQDSIEWWNKLLGEIGITRQQDIESGGLSVMSSNSESGLFPIDDSLAPATENTRVLEEDGHNGWAHILDLLNSDF